MENSPGTSGGRADSGTLITEQVKHGTQQAMQQTQQAAGQVAEQAKTQARTMFESQKGQISDQASTIATALRQTGDNLQSQNLAPAGNVINSAATKLEGFSSYLQQRNTDQLFYEAEDFARRNSTVFLGGAFALGLLAARFFKSSAQKSGNRPYGGRQYGGYGNQMYGGSAGYRRSSANTYDYGYGTAGQGTYGSGTAPHRFDDLSSRPGVTGSPYTGESAGQASEFGTQDPTLELETGLRGTDGTTNRSY